MSVTETVALASAATAFLLVILTTVYVVITYKILNANRRSVDAQERASQAQVLAKLVDDYFSPCMLSNMVALRNYQAANPANWAEEFGRLRRESYDDIKPIDEARRHIKGYFFRLYFLLKAKVVTEAFVKMIVVPNTAAFLLDVIEPLEAQINRDYEHEVYDRFQTMYHDELKAGRGRIVPPVFPVADPEV